MLHDRGVRPHSPLQQCARLCTVRVASPLSGSAPLRHLATMPISFKRLTSERSVCEFSHRVGSCRPLDFCLYDRYKYESKRSGIQIFFSSAKPAGGLLVEQDQGSRPTSHRVSAKSRKNRRRSRPFQAVGRTRPPAILSTLRAHRV